MEDQFNLTEYMSQSIECLIKDALAASYKNPQEMVFIMKYLAASKRAQKTRAAYEEKGRHIPPFLIASITNSCNLFCTGCYARANGACREHVEKEPLSSRRWQELFAEAQDLGMAFILLAGGEPLLRKDVITAAAGFKNIVFPVFTNGTLLDASYVQLFDKNRNLVPVLSLEGNRLQTDKRRGAGTYDTLRQVMDTLNQRDIFYGVSITVTTENIETVLGNTFIQGLYQLGCKVVFYVEYVPVTSSSEALAPGAEEREMLKERQRDLRAAYQHMIFISFPGNEEDMGGCLAAGRGFFHINAQGGVEPCPFSPYSDIDIRTATLLQALESPLFSKLNRAGMLWGEHKGGCLLFQKEKEVKALLAK